MSTPARRVFLVIALVVVGSAGWGISELLVPHGGNPHAGKFGAILAFILSGGMLLLGVQAWRRLHIPQADRLVSASTAVTSASDRQAATLNVERPTSSASDLFRIYSVRLDHRHVADLKIGQSVAVEVIAGEHTIEAQLAGKTAPPLVVVCAPNQRVHITVEPTPGSTAQRRTTGWLILTEQRNPEPGASFGDDARGQIT